MTLYRMANKFIIASALLSISSICLADWDVQRVYVKKVELFSAGAAVARVIYEFVPGISGKISFGCAQNDDEIVGLPYHYQATYWNSGTNTHHQILVGQLLAAQAQNIPVDLFFEASGCNNTASYGHGGLGRKMMGVSVSAE